MSMKKVNRTKEKTKNGEYIIREVFADNFIEEIKKLSGYLGKYNYVAMDTEFPGVVYHNTTNTREAYYRTIKTNVDKLKLIQLGITISNENGDYPPECATWQFNLKFDLNNDQYSNESIALLTNSGINFEMLESRGIRHEVFGEYIISSGLVLNEDINWISFHGIYDFAYFLRVVTNLPLPETENSFFEHLKIYFANLYDIRHLVRFNDAFRGSLAKLGQELNVARIGTQHQAGSDSLITSEIFFKLKKEYISDESTRSDKNVLFGLGVGIEDPDSLNYTNNIYYNSQFKLNMSNNNSNSNYGYDYSNFYQQQNLINMQYGYMRNNPTYFQNLSNMNTLNSINNLNTINNYYPYNGYNQMGVQFPVNMINNIPNISEETKKKYNLKGIVED
jgi:CCR4-NOT transcription complex subunit 7/8